MDARELQYHKDYREKNKEHLLVVRREYVKNNKEKLNAKGRRFSVTPKGIYKTLKNRSKLSGYKICSQPDFLEWLSGVQKQCIYCLTPENELPIIHTRGKNISRITIERLDNTEGYIVSNLALACFVCNATRSDVFTVEEMKEIGPLLASIINKRII